MLIHLLHPWLLLRVSFQRSISDVSRVPFLSIRRPCDSSILHFSDCPIVTILPFPRSLVSIISIVISHSHRFSPCSSLSPTVLSSFSPRSRLCRPRLLLANNYPDTKSSTRAHNSRIVRSYNPSEHSHIGTRTSAHNPSSLLNPHSQSIYSPHKNPPTLTVLFLHPDLLFKLFIPILSRQYIPKRRCGFRFRCRCRF